MCRRTVLDLLEEPRHRMGTMLERLMRRTGEPKMRIGTRRVRMKMYKK